MAAKQRRRSNRSARRTQRPNPPNDPPVVFTPGLADQMLRELAPLLADEGIDINDLDAQHPDALQRALNRAVERHNLALFTPVGQAREIAAVTLRLVVEAIAEDNPSLAAAILDQIQPDSPDNTTATVAGCIGLTLALLDEWLTGHHPDAPRDLAQQTQLPDGHRLDQPTAADIIALARNGRAFRSLDTLHLRQGGQALLYGSALALPAAAEAWAQHTATPVPTLVRTIIR